MLIVLINVATAPAARQELAVFFDHLPDHTWTLTPPPSSPLPPRSFKLTLVSAPAAKAHAEANIMAMNLTIVTSCTIVYTGDRETSIKEKEQKRRILNSAQMMYLVVLPFLFYRTISSNSHLWNIVMELSVQEKCIHNLCFISIYFYFYNNNCNTSTGHHFMFFSKILP